MVDLSISLARRALPGLLSVKSADASISQWITTGYYRISEDSDEGVLILSGFDEDSVLRHIQFDYGRFVLSSLETLKSSVESGTPKAAAWPLLKRYYAAFFAAHAILRAMGVGVIRIDASSANYLTQLGKVFLHDEYKLPGGSYVYTMRERQNVGLCIELREAPNSGNGVHMALWSYMNTFLNEYVSDIVAKGEEGATEIAARITELQTILKQGGKDVAGCWLSYTRNQMNYRHDYGVWFPYRPPATYRRHLPAMRTDGLRLDFNVKKTPVQAFDAATTFISVLNYELCNRLAARSGRKTATLASDWQRLCQIVAT
jgi:hypothetical protein